MQKKPNTNALAAAIATAAVAALTTAQVQALATTDLQALATDQVQALSTQPPEALTTAQVAVIGAVPMLLRQVVIEEMNIQNFKLEKRHVVREDDATDLPESLTLFSMFSYLDDEGQPKSWGAGQVVTDPDEMRDLIAHGALFLPDPEPAADGV